MCELVLIQGETFFFDTTRRPFEDLLYATLVIKTVFFFSCHTYYPRNVRTLMEVRLH